MLSFFKLILTGNYDLAKYLSVSIGVYIYIILAIYLLVDYFEIDKVAAYVSIYMTAYIFEYMLTLRVVFKREHRWGKVIKFICYVAGFLVLSTYMYKALILVDVHYLLSALSVAIFLMPFRFYANKYWVYR